MAARVVGTWELYLVAFAFVTVVAVAWVLVLATGRQLQVDRTVTPAQPIAGDALTLSLRVTNGWCCPGYRSPC